MRRFQTSAPSSFCLCEVHAAAPLIQQKTTSALFFVIIFFPSLLIISFHVVPWWGAQSHPKLYGEMGAPRAQNHHKVNASARKKSPRVSLKIIASVKEGEHERLNLRRPIAKKNTHAYLSLICAQLYTHFCSRLPTAFAHRAGGDGKQRGRGAMVPTGTNIVAETVMLVACASFAA